MVYVLRRILGVVGRMTGRSEYRGGEVIFEVRLGLYGEINRWDRIRLWIRDLF